MLTATQQEGYDAYMSGVLIEHNPYSDTAGFMWAEGWYIARDVYYDTLDEVQNALSDTDREPQ